MNVIFGIIGFLVLVAVIRLVAVAVFSFVAQLLPELFKGISDILGLFTQSRVKDAPKVVTPPPARPLPAGHVPDDVPAPLHVPAPSVAPRKLELSVEMGPCVGIAQCLLVKVRGGPVLSTSLKVVYVVTASYMEKGTTFAVAAATPFSDPPRPFRGAYLSPTDPAKSDDWVLLRLLDLDRLIPPRRGFQTYQFACQVYLLDQDIALDATPPIGSLIATSLNQVNLNFGAPGYLDVKEWEEPRRLGISLLMSILHGCTVDLATKQLAVKDWVNKIDLVGLPSARKQLIHGRLLSEYQLLQTTGTILGLSEQLRLVGALSSNQDYHFQREIVLLAVQMAGAEPLGADCRHVLQQMVSLLSAATYTLNSSDLLPKPPLQVAPTPPTPPTPPVKPVKPAKTSFELKLVPYAEKAVVKGVEVFVQGGGTAASTGARRLDFWLWDAAMDEPFLVACPDIDEVHQRAVHQANWPDGKYDASKWQSAGLIRFNEALPPRGGPRALLVAGRFSEFSNLTHIASDATSRSQSLSMDVASSGYQKIRQARLELRQEALVLAFGLALISGKSPTHMQETALKAFADQLCSGLADKAYADSCREAFRALLESTTVSDFDHLTRMLEAFARKAPPELKTQLHDAFVRIIAARKVRSKESRELLRYSAEVLAA